jgi:phage recombination protein Bet
MPGQQHNPAQAELKTAIEAAAAQPLARSEQEKISEAIARRGLNEETWRALRDTVFPNCKPESVLMAVDYCKARHLDPLLKPVHIVPMEVTVRGQSQWRDVVMPGIYLYRIIAHRTQLYLGHTDPEFGDAYEFREGYKVPAWCRMVFKRWNPGANQVMEFPVKVIFDELVVLKDGGPNRMWAKRPVGQMVKCCEAAGLREAFPEELGGTHTDDEMAGRTIELDEVGVSVPRGKPHAEEPAAVVATNGAAKKTWDKVPIVELAEMIDKVGVPMNQFLAYFELGQLDELPLNQVANAFEYLEGLAKAGAPP